MNVPRTILLTGVALAIVAVGATIVSSQQDSDETPEATETDPSSAPAETPETGQTPETQATVSPTPTSEPPTPEKQRPTTYVGRVDGGGATLAVVADGGEATAYFCDGVEIEAWLGGKAFAGRLELSGDNGSMDARVDEQSTSGSVRVEGQRFGFTLRQVDPPQGLYRFADTIDGAEVKGGWIVLPSGRQVGLLSVDGQTQPAPRLDTETGEVRVDGQDVTVEQLS